MELRLTGRRSTAEAAERCGLVTRAVPAADLLREASDTASCVALMPRPSLTAIKHGVERSLDTSLSEGLHFERRMRHAPVAPPDQREDMAAVVGKRAPHFSRS
ncbi:enoyl-CoA hydratase-related protein [Inquilinus sp. OTU3971]|uniref:enoyl-CoA hydratase-related protein n=1 Tax=Inquilinus sp. OTU3971 TaxID=3043855 RepID=UPI00406C59A1